jgi:hypothetical protein
MQRDLGPRLGDHPHDVLCHVLGLKPAGLAVEFGVYKGTTLRMIADVMPVVGFDSFEGLPEDWRPDFPAGRFACAVPDVPGARLVVGRFEDTLPAWARQTIPQVGLVHIDCDLYSSTATVLQHLEAVLRLDRPFVVFDEYHGYPGCEQHEAKAWAEFEARTGVQYDVIGHGPEQWAIRLR